MANAKMIWNPDGKSTQYYVFPVNFTWNYWEAHQDEADRQRALDGTLRSYQRASKQYWYLDFKYITPAQKEQFWKIKEAGVDIDFYRDAEGSKTMTCAWVNDFDFTEVLPGGYWSGTMELEEV